MNRNNSAPRRWIVSLLRAELRYTQRREAFHHCDLSPARIRGTSPDRVSTLPPPITISTIYINGDILTGAHLLPDDPSPFSARVSAIAISEDGRIAASGDNSSVLLRKTDNTKVIDLNGA